MQIQSQTDLPANQAIFAIQGEIDLYTFPPFVEGVMAALGAGKTRILIDCSELSYLDSSGVGSIIRLSQEAKRLNAKLAFKGLAGTPLKVLSMSHILSILHTVGSVADIETFFRN